MRIVIAGSSGFLAAHLMPALRLEGYEITRLVRRPPKGADEVRWNPDGGELDPDALADVDAVINLAGANIGERRWTPEFKAKLVSSRVNATGTIARTAAGLPEPRRPRSLLNASAVGYYGETGDQPVTEDDEPGDDFFADLCRQWERATAPAEDAGIRVVRLRSGLPLSHDGGFLKPMLLQFRLFAGGRMGSGRQFLPWMSLADWVAAVRFLLDRTDIAGPVNLSGPEAVRNGEFAAVLGRILHRPAIWPVPAFAMRLVLGELAGEAIKSQRMRPGVLQRTGYEFQHPDIESGLRAALR
jgi:uncharacterized protein